MGHHAETERIRVDSVAAGISTEGLAAAGAPSVPGAYGRDDAEILHRSGIEGAFIDIEEESK